MEKDVEFVRPDKKTIRGLLFVPDKPVYENPISAYVGRNMRQRKPPLIIFSHGFGSNFGELKHHGYDIAESEIMCLFFDFCGGGMASHSDGALSRMTILTELEDLEFVLNSVRQWDIVDNDNIFLVGESMGGFISALMAARHEDMIKGMVLWYPAFIIPDDAKKRLAVCDNTYQGLKLNPSFNEIAAGIDIYKEISAYTKNVRILHGDMDRIVPLEYSMKAVEVYQRAELVVIKGAGHGFEGKQSVNARRRTIRFVRHYSKLYNREIW